MTLFHYYYDVSHDTAHVSNETWAEATSLVMFPFKYGNVRTLWGLKWWNNTKACHSCFLHCLMLTWSSQHYNYGMQGTLKLFQNSHYRVQTLRNGFVFFTYSQTLLSFGLQFCTSCVFTDQKTVQSGKDRPKRIATGSLKVLQEVVSDTFLIKCTSVCLRYKIALLPKLEVQHMSILFCAVNSTDTLQVLCNALIGSPAGWFICGWPWATVNVTQRSESAPDTLALPVRPIMVILQDSLACETVLGTNWTGGLYGLHACNVLYDADELIMAEIQEHVKQTQVQQLLLSAATCLISTDVKCLYGKH